MTLEPTPEYFEELGRLSVAYANLEFQVALLLCRAREELDDPLKLTSRQGQVVEHLRRVGSQLHGDRSKVLRELHTDLVEVRDARHRYAHSVVMLQAGGLVNVHPRLPNEEVPLDVHDLRRLRLRMEGLAGRTLKISADW